MVRVGDFCRVNAESKYALEKARMYSVNNDKMYYCYGIIQDTLLLTRINGNSKKTYTYKKGGKNYNVDYTNIIKVPSVIMVSTGLYLTPREVTALKNKHLRWKDKIASKRETKSANINRDGYNKQYIRIVSGGAVSPK